MFSHKALANHFVGFKHYVLFIYRVIKKRLNKLLEVVVHPPTNNFCMGKLASQCIYSVKNIGRVTRTQIRIFVHLKQ